MKCLYVGDQQGLNNLCPAKLELTNCLQGLGRRLISKAVGQKLLKNAGKMNHKMSLMRLAIIDLQADFAKITIM